MSSFRGRHHPPPEMLLAWAASHEDVASLRDEIEEHVASCVSPCGQYASIAFAALDEVDDDGPPPTAAPPDAARLARWEETARVRRGARSLMDGPPESWGTMVHHPDARVPMFAIEIAERLVYLADEKPEAVLAALPAARGVAAELHGAELEECLSLCLLAEGVARRTQGDHVAALACYARAGSLVSERPTSLVYARAVVQRAASLRTLRRVDEARGELVLAGQLFGRLGVTGSGVVLWELANLAWQEGQPRRAFRLARQASDTLAREGDRHQARMALHTAASALISLGRARVASRLVDRLEVEMGGGAYERALVAWKRGKIAPLLGRGQEGLGHLAAAAELLGQAGSVLAAAEALVDRAVLAGELGETEAQIESASRSVALLSVTPAHVGELALAVGELEAALASRGAITALLLRVRHVMATR